MKVAVPAPVAVMPDLKEKFTGIGQVDSISLDPHKWLYRPLEAGCVLVKNPRHLTDTLSSNPEYDKFENKEGETTQNFRKVNTRDHGNSSEREEKIS